MKGILFLSLIILTFGFGAVNAQNLHHGGKPKLFESKGGIRAYEVKFPNGVTVRKFDRKTETDAEGFFKISRGSKILPEIFGIAQANISLPEGISLLDIWENPAGKKVILNSYPPHSFDENKRVRYKLLFLQ